MNNDYYELKLNIQNKESISGFYHTHIVSYTNHREFMLSNSAQRILNCKNAGGNSILSEALSAELFDRIFGINYIKTEMEIQYIYSNWKIADYLINICNKNVGVSVTRAMSYFDPTTFSVEDAKNLLVKKIEGLILARSSASTTNAFYTSILHIWCQLLDNISTLREAYKLLPEKLKDNIIIVCTFPKNMEYLFKNISKQRKKRKKRMKKIII